MNTEDFKHVAFYQFHQSLCMAEVLASSVHIVIGLRDHWWFCVLVLLTWTKQFTPDVDVQHSELFIRIFKTEAADSQQQVQVH